MSSINNHDYTYQQIGWGQSADINATIHNHILGKAAFTQGTAKYQPRQSSKAPFRGIARTIQGAFSSLLLS